MIKKKVAITKKRTVKKRVSTTHDAFVQSMSAEQRKEYDEGYRDFLLSELLIAIMKNDAISVRELAKEAGISAAIIQGIRSGEKQNITTQSFFKILQALGCSLIVRKDKQLFPIELVQ